MENNLKDWILRNIGKSRKIQVFTDFYKSVGYLANYWKYYRNNYSGPSSIREINIELANFCNLRCKWCALDHDKPKIRMAKELLDRLLNNLLSDKRFRKVQFLHFHNGGETLLHPDIPGILSVVKKYRDKAAVEGKPFPKVTMLTNAIALTEVRSREILDSGIVDILRFSMDGGSREKFEEIRVRAKWDLFYKNVMTFCELNEKAGHPVHTGIITMIESEKPLSIKWMESDFRKLLNTVDTYELRHPHDWAGDVEIGNAPVKNRPLKRGCTMLMQQLVLLPGGDVTICCADLNSKGVIGNLLKDDLYSIYNSPVRREWLKLLLQNRKSEVDLCRECETY